MPVALAAVLVGALAWQLLYAAALQSKRAYARFPGTPQAWSVRLTSSCYALLVVQRVVRTYFVRAMARHCYLASTWRPPASVHAKCGRDARALRPKKPAPRRAALTGALTAPSHRNGRITATGSVLVQNR